MTIVKIVLISIFYFHVLNTEKNSPFSSPTKVNFNHAMIWINYVGVLHLQFQGTINSFGFFMADNSPNLNDHDFPNPGYLIVTSGYQRLKIGNCITSEFNEPSANDTISIEAVQDTQVEETGEVADYINVTVDKLGRKHYVGLHAGP